MRAPNYNVKTLIVGVDVTFGEDGFVTKSQEDFEHLVALFTSGVKLYVQGKGEFSEGDDPYYINELVIKFEDSVGVFETMSGFPIIMPLE